MVDNQSGIDINGKLRAIRVATSVSLKVDLLSSGNGRIRVPELVVYYSDVVATSAGTLEGKAVEVHRR